MQLVEQNQVATIAQHGCRIEFTSGSKKRLSRVRDANGEQSDGEVQALGPVIGDERPVWMAQGRSGSGPEKHRGKERGREARSECNARGR